MINTHLWIDGRDVHGAGAALSSRNPADASLVFNGTAASDEQVAAAFSAAERAQYDWARTPLAEREAIVLQYAELLGQREEELAQLITREIGKLPSDARGEVAAAIAKAQITIDAMHERRGDIDIPIEHGSRALRYRPLGPVLVLGPYNFPAHLPGGHLIPALLAGNTVVFKPSELAAAVGRWMIDRWTEAGLPAGVLNLIQGDATVARLAVDNPRTAGVFLTGGYAAGKAIHRQLAGRPEVLLALELGGNNPVVVASPSDPEQTAEKLSLSAFLSAGQRCTCARRLIVIDTPAGRQTVAALCERIDKLRCGLPHEQPEPDIGPMISARHANLLQQAEANFLAYGGHAIREVQQVGDCGALLRPGIVDMTDCHDAVDDEWFGPLLQLYWVKDFEAALQRAQATRYGLAAGLFGGDEAMFETFRQQVGAGVVNWNAPTTGASGRLPFGGLGASGNHRPAGYHTIDFCNDPIASLIIEPEESSP
ncbi:succinylglutamate-semialdehyde dehydrogenase [Roseimaritima ulvae]|uniref:L-glutamate gamma-semialdehyde dehydrogenase n=1 Tax=Roseimaritima ulvae TaxID=980254 RepID=A0A5B9QLJ6_9BACT|nr:succinylglutamate-semialdehyde dehydrogenase [Roseimaritima ulvae]QEG38405.1 N-succinylglutamate 5-semialdehyde dehydrogenase [Roseimaritima ulvae]